MGERFANSRNITEYINNTDITESKRKISDHEKITEFVMLGMRLASGVSRAEFCDKFDFSFDELYGERFKKYINSGFVVDNGDNIFFSDKGFFVSNYILSDVLDFD